MKTRVVLTIHVGALLVAAPALSDQGTCDVPSPDRRAEYRPAQKTAIFMGGENAQWRSNLHASAPDSLIVTDLAADVGYPRDIASQLRTAERPFGIARRLAWTGRGHARYSFRNAYGAAAQNGAQNAFLVFNAKVLETQPLGRAARPVLRVSLDPKPEQGRPASSCSLQYPLAENDLAARELWNTYRIPLWAFRPTPACPALHGGLDDRGSEPAVVSFENEGRQRLVIDLADVRLETYPHGWTFAQSLAEDLLRELTLDEKIGQMSQLVHRPGATAVAIQPADVVRLKIGSLYGDSGTPPHDDAGNLLSDSPGVWADFLDAYQRAALSTDKAIPILFGMDAVHGVALVPGATVFPHNIGLGAAGDPELLEAIGRVTAVEASAMGFRLTFGPTLAVARDERWGRTYESLSELPDVVERLGVALTRGLQGTWSRYDLSPLARPGSILATAKHFGGDGAGTFQGPGTWCRSNDCFSGPSVDRTSTPLDENELIALHLLPYLGAIQAGVGFVMSADSRWKGEVMTGSKRLLTDLLKGDFGFDGVVLTDYNSWSSVNPSDPLASMQQSLNAGNDMFMFSTEDGYWVLREVVENGLPTRAVSTERINDAVRRILQKKFELGLFDIPFAHRALLSEVGSPEHHELARRAVQQSLVLLQNRPDRFHHRSVLPLRRHERVYVAGKGANDIGMQSGGWTDTWQGTLGNASPGTTVLAGIQELSRASVVHSPDATADMSQSDVGVVVVGEYPYAEGCGDVLSKIFFCEFSRPNPSGLVRANPEIGFPFGLPSPQTMGLGTSSFDYYTPILGDVAVPVTVDPVSDLDVIRRVCSKMPCAVVLLSGRPLFIDEALRDADAFVAAWLPGAEGGGIADMLYSRDGVDFTGTLKHTWPRTPRDPKDPYALSATPEVDYVPQNAFVAGMGNLDHVLFPVGYGLKYRYVAR